MSMFPTDNAHRIIFWKFLRNNRGMALLITLAILTILIAAALELNKKVRANVASAATTRDQMTLSHMASSGVHAAMAMLIKDKMSDPSAGLDSIQEDWANPEKISEVLSIMSFDGGKVTFKITDELGKIQINALVDFPVGQKFNELQLSMWDNLIRPIVSLDATAEINASTNILNCVKDWLDSGDDDAITGLNGAESEYYEGLDPPYSCKNAPITDINELLLIKGFKPEFFYGGEEFPGIADHITAYGMTRADKKVNKKDFQFEGKVNINTAELPVLVALVGPENADYAQLMYEYRAEKEDTTFLNDVSTATWYKNIPEIPSDFTIRPELITITSDIFRIESTATLHDMELVVTAVVQREKDKKTKKWECKLLSWETRSEPDDKQQLSGELADELDKFGF